MKCSLQNEMLTDALSLREVFECIALKIFVKKCFVKKNCERIYIFFLHALLNFFIIKLIFYAFQQTG